MSDDFEFDLFGNAPAQPASAASSPAAAAVASPIVAVDPVERFLGTFPPATAGAPAAEQASTEFRTLRLWPAAFDALVTNKSILLEWSTTYRGELLVLRADYSLHNGPGHFCLLATLQDVRQVPERFRAQWVFSDLRKVEPIAGRADFGIGHVTLNEPLNFVGANR